MCETSGFHIYYKSYSIIAISVCTVELFISLEVELLKKIFFLGEKIIFLSLKKMKIET